MEFTFAETDSRAIIKVFGVGGGGGNAVNTMAFAAVQWSVDCTLKRFCRDQCG